MTRTRPTHRSSSTLSSSTHSSPALSSSRTGNTRASGTRAAVALAVGAAFAFSACGAIAEKAAEKGAEKIIEAETGGDVDLDVNGDGGFSVKTEDGSFSVDENGNFVVVDENGKVVTGSADEGGLVVQGEDGTNILDVDVNDDGQTAEITFEGDDGQGSFKTVTDIPDEWPSEVPRPSGLEVQGGQVIGGDGTTIMSVSGTVGSDPIKWAASYGAALEKAGGEQTSYYEADGQSAASYTLGTWSVTVSAFVVGDDTQVNVTVGSD